MDEILLSLLLREEERNIAGSTSNLSILMSSTSSAA